VTELRGPRVLLRPFRRDEIEEAWDSRAGRSDWTGKTSRAAFERRLSRSGMFVGGRIDFAIEADGRLVGELDARQPANALPPGVFEIGIALFDERDRGAGTGTDAVRLVTEFLFAECCAERVQASTAEDNAAMRRVLEKLGFACEGVMRAFMPAADARADYALYAVTRADWLPGR